MKMFDIVNAHFHSFVIDYKGYVSETRGPHASFSNRSVTVLILKGDKRIASLTFLEEKSDFCIETFTSEMQDVTFAVTTLYRLAESAEVAFRKELNPKIDRALVHVRSLFFKSVDVYDNFVERVRKAPHLPHSVTIEEGATTPHTIHVSYERNSSRDLKVDLRDSRGNAVIGFALSNSMGAPRYELQFPFSTTDVEVAKQLHQFLPHFTDLLNNVQQES